MDESVDQGQHVFTRTVSKNASRNVYIHLKLEFNAKECPPVTALNFKSIIFQSVKQIFGESGASIPTDLLLYDKNSMEGIIRVPGHGLTKIWSSLTLCSSYMEHDCVVRIKKVSTFLPCMASNSRTFVHDTRPKLQD